MELAWCNYLIILGIGLALGPICASLFFHIGGYTLPFYVVAITIYLSLPCIYFLELPQEEETESPKFFKAMLKIVNFFFIIERSFYCYNSCYGHFHTNILLPHFYNLSCSEVWHVN